MTQIFVDQFKKANICGLCGIKKRCSKAPGKSLCGAHLTAARLAFRLWAIDRRDAGRCVACERRADGVNCRCVKHRRMNRLKCRRWCQDNEARRQAYSVARQQKYLTAGLCPNCPEHRPLRTGFVRCRECQVYHNARRRKDDVFIQSVRQARAQTKLARKEIVRQDTIAQLRALGFEYAGTSPTGFRRL